MRDYMYEHNYGQMDYPEYSQDPEWQALNEQYTASLENTAPAEEITPESEAEFQEDISAVASDVPEDIMTEAAADIPEETMTEATADIPEETMTETTGPMKRCGTICTSTTTGRWTIPSTVRIPSGRR